MTNPKNITKCDGGGKQDQSLDPFRREAPCTAQTLRRDAAVFETASPLSGQKGDAKTHGDINFACSAKFISPAPDKCRTDSARKLRCAGGSPSPTADPPPMNRARGILALLVSTTGLGLSGMLTRGATRVDFFGGVYVAGQSIGAFMTVGRMVCGFLLFLTLLFVTRKAGLFRATRLTPSIALGGLFVGIALAFYMVATLLTTLADAVFLIYTGPLFATLLARVFRREQIKPVQWACLLVVFVGMLFTSEIIKINAGGLEFGFDFGGGNADYPQKALGDALGLLSGLFYGVSLFFNGYRRDCDSVVRGVWNFLFATAGSFGVACVMAIFWPLGVVDMSAGNWAFAVALWMICGPVGLGLLLVAGRNLAAVEYSTIAYWECIVSIAAGVVVFGESLSAPTILGGALILAGGALPIVLCRPGPKNK